MAGRPRKSEKTKTRGRKGTGTISEKTQKVDRKEHRLSKMCKICSECKDRSVCNNRIGTKKCKKCLECNGKDCDRFYVYTFHTALAPQVGNRNRNYLGRYETKKEAQFSIDKAKNGGFIEKSNTTLFQILEKKNKIRLDANKINSNTYDRNKTLRNKMVNCGLANKPIQKITTTEIQNYLNSLKDTYSQSEIDKHTNEINSGFRYGIKYGLISENPCDNIEKVKSTLSVKIARPFEIDEQNLLMDFINTHDKLTDIRSRMDSITFKNIVKLAFFTGQRIGELLALQTGFDKKHYTSDINFEKEVFIISKTITRENGKFILGTKTKNAEKRERQGLPDEREIQFDIVPNNVVKDILLEQIEHSKTFKNNTNHFLFCNSNGTFVTPSQVTITFKRICRKLHIQEDNPDGCFIHQARHSFVTRCLEAGLKVETIADLIGDTVTQVQETYAHILKKFRQDELSNLHNYYKNNNLIT